MRDKNGRFIKGHKGYWKDKSRPPFTEEWKSKMNKDKIGKKRPPEVVEAIRKANTGKTHSEETKKKLSEYWKGKRKGVDNPTWKGDDVGYMGLHMWIKSICGTPRKCEFCGTEKAKRYDWANKDHKYRRNLDDWIRLCYKCHYEYDKKLRREIKYGK